MMKEIVLYTVSQMEKVLSEIRELRLSCKNPYFVEVNLKERRISIKIEIGGKEKCQPIEQGERKITIGGFRTFLEAYGFASYLWKELITKTGKIYGFEENLNEVIKKTE
jgi:hypothetical protein